MGVLGDHKMPMTEAEIRAISTPKRRVQFTDGSGLYLDVLPTGKRTWIFRYRSNGEQQRVTIGRYPDLTLKAARKRRDELAGQVALGKDPARLKKAGRRGLTEESTVEEFAEKYYAEQVVPHWKKPVHVRRYLDNEVIPNLGRKALVTVTALDVQAVVYRKRDQGHISAAMQLRGILKRMFEYAIELHLVSSNPAAMVGTRYIGKVRSRSRVLSPKELKIYLRTVYSSNLRRQFKLALHLLLLTLARKSELLLARWEHVHLKAGEWSIPVENAKTGKPHIVYLSRQAMRLFGELKNLAGKSQLVLPGRGSTKRPFAANALNKAVESLSIPIEPVTIHDLRRTGATLLTENGFNRDVIEKALSHEARGIRAVYIVAEFAEQRKEMLQWWADYIDSLVTEHGVVNENFGVAVPALLRIGEAASLLTEKDGACLT